MKRGGVFPAAFNRKSPQGSQGEDKALERYEMAPNRVPLLAAEQWAFRLETSLLASFALPDV
jgi:hypothetical protein